jgi:hypothetical protein
MSDSRRTLARAWPHNITDTHLDANQMLAAFATYYSLVGNALDK